jgi:hypothetical protein
MVYESNTEINGWCLLDPEADGIEYILNKECPENPMIMINNVTDALQYLQPVLESWNSQSKSKTTKEELDTIKQCGDEDNSSIQQNASAQFIGKMVEAFAMGLPEMFAIERRHKSGHTEPNNIPVNLKRVPPPSTPPVPIPVPSPALAPVPVNVGSK